MKPMVGISYTTKQVFALELVDEPKLQYRSNKGELIDASDELRTSKVPDSVTWAYHGLSGGREIFRHNGGCILQAVSI